MDGAMGKKEDVVEAVLTCQGDFHDPELQNHIERFKHRLKDLLLTDSRELQVKKVEPWNSVKVTFTLPREAAARLRHLAQNGSEGLQQLGVLSVQVQGDTQVPLNLVGSNNEQVAINVSSAPQISSSSSTSIASQQQVPNPLPTEAAVPLDNLASSPGPSSDEVTRKNIVDYLRQGPHVRQNTALIGSIMGAVGAVSSSPRLGMGQDIPTVSNPTISNVSYKSHSHRPNNIANVGMAASHLQGSHVTKNLSFKTTGAFQPPVPRHAISVGQSMTSMDSAFPPPSSSHLKLQTNSTNSPLPQPASIRQVSAAPETNQRSFVSGMNNFNQLRHPFQPSGPNKQNLTSPSVASSSNYYVDLPPPPPYPHGPNSVGSPRTNNPGNSSSPMLVNLLQTDPSVAAAGMASGNPNKPLGMGEVSTMDTPPKKKRKKKLKTTPSKPLLNEFGLSQNNFLPSSQVPSTVNSSGNPISLAQTADTFRPSNSQQDASSSLDSFGGNNKVSVSIAQCYPIKDSHKGGFSLGEIQSNLSKSAIASRTDTSLLLDPNRQLSRQQADVFSPETAAGKIINPYTGQLEPRDTLTDSSMQGLKDPGISRQNAYSATQILAQRALELDEIAQKSVPQSSSALLDNVHSVLHVSSSTLNLFSATSNTTAATSSVTSGEPSISKTTLSIKGSLIQPSIQTSSSLLYPSTQNVISISSGAEPPSIRLKESCSMEAISKTVGYGLSNGPLTSDNARSLSHLTPSEARVLHVTGTSSSSSDSVIYSNLRASSSYSTNVQASFINQISDQGTQIKASPVSVSQSPLSLSVSLDIPSAQTRLSSPVTSAEQSKPSIINHPPYSHRQAAVPTRDSKALSSSVATTPSLLNSVRDKHIDSSSSTESPPEAKIQLEGDENTDHAGLITDAVPEQSASAVLIEHSRVKTENHDSGVGSSSERSDDTPSEPGDGDFRTGHPANESEDSTTKGLHSHKLIDCKTELPLPSVSSSITVGYVVSSSSGTGGKPSFLNRGVGKRSFVEPVSSAESSGSNISQFYDDHCKSLEKQAGLMAVEQVPLTSKWSEKAGFDHSQHGSKVKENGPMFSSVMDSRTSSTLNGPTSQGSLNSMMAAMNELQNKKMKLSPKQGGMNSKDLVIDEQQLKESVMDKLNRLHHQLEDQKESSLSPLGCQEIRCEVTPDKSQSDGSSRLEGHTEQLFLDLEEMQMKMMGNGTSVVAAGGSSVEGKRSNITSIYSKRSSPVNVNMLNHIYTSGLPLPRRLTESVQRLVKPLPASEMNMSLSLPQSRAYNSKSPVSSNVGALSKAGPSILSSTNGPHHPARMANHSGARSPGASMPRLIPNDQHRLLSGGLDLAGLSSLQIPLGYGAESVSVRGGSNSVVGHMSALSSFSLRENMTRKGDSLSMNFNSSPNLSDSQSYSNRMLSQSYPPFKSKDHLANVVQRNHNVQVNLNSSYGKDIVQHSSKDIKLDSLSNIQEKGNVQYSISKSHFFVEKEDSKLSNNLLGEETGINHSNKCTDSSEPRGLIFSSNASTIVHSNAPSPLMPILQKGQEPPITPTLPSTMPSISSHPPLISLATTEISSCHEVAISKPTVTATVNKLQPVPCAEPSSRSSSSTNISPGTAKADMNVFNIQAPLPKLPTLNPVVRQGLGQPDEGLADHDQWHARNSLHYSQEHVTNDRFDPPQLTKAQAFTPVASISAKASTPNYQLNRNIFDTVSIDSTTATTSSVSPKSASVDYETKPPLKENQPKACDNSQPGQNIIERVVEKTRESMEKSLEPVNSKNGSKQLASVTQSYPVSDNAKIAKAQSLPTTTQPKTKTAVSSSTEKSSEKVQSKTTFSEIRVSTTSSKPFPPNLPLPISASSTAALVKDKSPSTGNSMANSSVATEAAKQEIAVSSLNSHITPTESTSAVAKNLGNGDTCVGEKGTGAESNICSSPVKEPILETLASALMHQKRPPYHSSLSNPGQSSNSLEKSPATQKAPMIPLSPSDISKLEQTMTLQGRMVAIQSSTQIKSPVIDQSQPSCTSSEPIDQGSSSSRITRKRKPNSSDSESNDVPNAKSASLGSNNKEFSEELSNRPGKIITKNPSDFVEIGVVHTKAVPNPNERSEPKKALSEHKDSAAKISADLEKSQERRRHRSISSSKSDDGHSHRSSSNESRDSTSPSHRDGRSNRTVPATPDKDGRSHRSSGALPPTNQQRETKFYPKAHAETSSKENRSHRVPGHHSSEDARHTSVDWSEDHSREEKDKTKLSGSKVFTPGEKFSSPDGKDDGQKKGQRVKRQFYAYVPEKSLDQTYFDTPILSGRTRSKNKPTEEEALGPGGAAPSPVGDGQASSTGAHSSTTPSLPVAGQAVGHSKHAGDQATATASDTVGGKRSTRSVRTKDTSQEQNPNKRRKVQQQR